MKYIFFGLSFIGFAQIAAAQKDTLNFSHSFSQKAITLRVDKGNVFVHTNAVKDIQGAKPFGISMEFSKQSSDNAMYQLTSSYPRKGIILSYFDYGTPILGKGVIVGYFLQPNYRISDRFTFYIRGTIGISYLSNPYSADKNPDNRNYSQYVNPYLHVGAGLGYRINSHFGAELGTNFQHISNGNFTQPNKGLNWTTTSLSFVYYPDNNILPKYRVVKNKYWKGAKPTLDIGLFYVAPQDYISKWQAKRNNAVGVSLQLSKQFGRTNALSIAGEVYYNNITPDANTTLGNNKSSVLSSLMIGHEFLLGRIIFSQQIGMYITPHPSYFTTFFERFGLRYKITDHWQAGFNLKANTDDADFVDFRVLYRL
ncbi:acyloxyacyl hydrolase [Chitinophagaceae bacterium LWZ2-11]